MTTLCFLDASEAHKSGRISWDEYLRCLLIHLTGVKHKQDEIDGMSSTLRYADPFGFGLFCWNRRLKEKVTDIAPFEAVFQAYRKHSVTEAQDKLAALEKPEHHKEIRRALAFLALKEREAKTLDMCLKARNFPYEAYFAEEADRVEQSNDPETFRVLEESDFRKYYPHLPPGPPRDDTPAATFDRGGKYPVDW